MASSLYWCFTKGTVAEGDQLKYGTNWMFARRALLKVYDDHIQCRDWRIDYPAIANATLYSVGSIFGSGYVLKIQTAGKTYHFGLMGNSFWRRELPFPVTREKIKLKYSAFSVVVRLAALGFLGYYIWSKLQD